MTTAQQARDLANLPASERKLVSKIIVATARELRMDYQRLIDPECIVSPASDGRRYCYYLIRQLCPTLTLEQIGGLFSRSVSSVSKDIGLVADWIKGFQGGTVHRHILAIKKGVGA